MERMAPFVIAYLLGTITPVMFLRYFLGHMDRSNGEGCFLNLFLIGATGFIAFFLFMWVKFSLSTL